MYEHKTKREKLPPNNTCIWFHIEFSLHGRKSSRTKQCGFHHPEKFVSLLFLSRTSSAVQPFKLREVEARPADWAGAKAAAEVARREAMASLYMMMDGFGENEYAREMSGGGTVRRPMRRCMFLAENDGSLFFRMLGYSRFYL